jgi:hypothetical protein
MSRESLNINESNPEIDKIKDQLFGIWDQYPKFTLVLQNGKSWVDQISIERNR